MLTKNTSHRGLAPVFVLILIGIVGSAAIFVLTSTQKQETISSKISNALTVSKSPSPSANNYPFQEMTIPALRARDYKSSIGSKLKVSETGTYTSYVASYESDGLKVNALLTEPKGAKPAGGWPAIIFVHGYIPPEQYKTEGNYAAYVDYLARNEFVVFKIDLRGHGSSEGESYGGYNSPDYVVDTLNAHAALSSSELVNKENIGLWGHSMAGNIVMRSFAARPQIAGVVIWAGAVYTYLDQQQFGIDDNSYRPPPQDSERARRREELMKVHGTPSPESAFWKLVAPSNYLSDLQGAVEIHHAVDDIVVDIRYSRNLMSLLAQTKVPHQLYEYQSGGHNINGGSFSVAMQRTVEFFKKYL